MRKLITIITILWSLCAYADKVIINCYEDPYTQTVACHEQTDPEALSAQ